MQSQHTRVPMTWASWDCQGQAHRPCCPHLSLSWKRKINLTTKRELLLFHVLANTQEWSVKTGPVRAPALLVHRAERQHRLLGGLATGCCEGAVPAGRGAVGGPGWLPRPAWQHGPVIPEPGGQGRTAGFRPPGDAVRLRLKCWNHTAQRQGRPVCHPSQLGQGES